MLRVGICCAMTLIGDAILGLLTPNRHLRHRRWSDQPVWRRFTRSLVHRALLARAAAAAEFDAAIWWASRFAGPSANALRRRGRRCSWTACATLSPTFL